MRNRLLALVALVVAAGALWIQRQGSGKARMLDGTVASQQASRRAQPGGSPSRAGSAELDEARGLSRASLRFSERLQDLLKQPDSHQKLADLDRAMEEFLESSSVKRGDKIAALMDVLEKVEGNQALYVLDHLAHLVPVEEVSALIERFEGSPDPEMRRHLLSAMRDMLVVDWETMDIEAPPTGEERRSEEAVSRLAERLALSGNDAFAKYAVLEMVPLLPEDAQARVLASLDSRRASEISISPQELTSLYFDVAIASPNEANIGKFREAIDASSLEGEPDFVERSLAVLVQVSGDPRFSDFSREVLGRVGDLSLSPALFVKAKQLEISLAGTPEERRPAALVSLYSSSGTLERSAIVLGADQQLPLHEGDEERQRSIEEFYSAAGGATGATRQQLLSAALAVSSELEDPRQREASERKVCLALGDEYRGPLCGRMPR